jgi:hypothetical protein
MACGIVHELLKHKECMQEKCNEELRLHIQLEQVRHGRVGEQNMPLSSDPLPKDVSWDEQMQAPYEMGYQQMNRP